MNTASSRLLSAAAAMLLVAIPAGAGGQFGPGMESAAVDGPGIVQGAGTATWPVAVIRPAADPSTAASADDPTEVGWRLLAKLNYRTGEKTEELAALDGQLVKVPGFTVPLEDFASSATEFLLVPYVGACIHTPPPPPNQLVYIQMDEGKRAKMDGWNPVWVEGVLKIEMTESVYGYVGFTIVGERVYPYEA